MPCVIVLSRTAPNSLGIWESDGDIPLEAFRRWFKNREEVNDTAFWQRYPNGEPWFALEWKDGRISLWRATPTSPSAATSQT